MMSTHDGWMTIREASLAWGVSELTVRRRIKDGKVESRLENGKYYVRGEAQPVRVTSRPEAVGRVREDTTPAETDSRTARAHPTALSEAFDVQQLLAEYGRLAEQAGRARLLEEQLHAAEARYAALQEGTVSLATRNGWLESKLEERDQEIKLLADSRHKPPWWKRLFGGSSR